MDTVERLRTLARLQTAQSEYTPEEHIAWVAADEIERLRRMLGEEPTGIDYASMSNAELIENLRGMAGLNHVGLITHLAAERLDQMRLALIDSRARTDALEEIAAQDPIELALDPEWAQRIAKAALGRL